jgi:hypothetical protein
MYGFERVRPALNIEAHCIHDAKRAFDGSRDRLPLANIGDSRPDLRIMAARGSRMPGGDPHRKPLVPEVANHPASEKAAAAKHAHNLTHCASVFPGFRSCSSEHLL